MTKKNRYSRQLSKTNESYLIKFDKINLIFLRKFDLSYQILLNLEFLYNKNLNLII